MYSVDTDARNDQDVERNITAATLVAEEIEFLGGRAILENIFARPPSARDTADTSIINMDQVDVAFVLAPWTPSEKRIARLINFVDQGGGAVLLSFIGGLSKGVWRDLEYEPLITGKVADNTPYEDVYLSSPAIASLDVCSLKRSQELLLLLLLLLLLFVCLFVCLLLLLLLLLLGATWEQGKPLGWYRCLRNKQCFACC
ncbi:unnamed protein product [Polarella glacialis]|uniref:Uncharacterized protein n=1 Tax=Polarella glacialis TaxID=89957 RepID=A0A813FBH7_POLGL|nr:unnamed protein product [Polarella glacialis]